MTIDDFIARLEHAKKNGRGWTACCPGHEDAKNSLSINRADDGRILLKCFAGCTANAIVAALGLTLRDLFPPHRSAHNGGRRGVTIAELAAAKGLSEERLRQWGCRDEGGRVVIPYFDEQGQETDRPHVRTALRAVDGSQWGGPRGGPLTTPYGAWRLKEFRKTGTLIICEGETDTWTLWHIEQPAIGIPGAAMWQMLRPALVRGFEHVVVCCDNDARAGDAFARGCAGVAVTAGATTVQIIRAPDGCKDPNDWYRRNPAAFEQELRAAIAVAPRFDPSQAEDGTRATATPRPVSEPVLVRVADVQPEEVSWIWPGRVARRKVNLIVGDPGLGKSMITLDAAARVTRGAAWPEGGLAPLGDVVILTAEDGLADTVRPRLDLLDADVTRVHVLCAIREKATGVERSVSLATDLEPLERAGVLTHAVLVIIDPVSAYLGMANSYRDSDVRAILAPLHALAERTGAAIWGVMHLTKDQQRQPLYRAQGSIGFVGAARLVLAVGADPNDESHERRFLMPVKSNLCAPAATLAYRIVSVGARGRLVWEASPVDGVDVNAILAPQRPQDAGERRDAEAFLRDQLADGPVGSFVLLKAAEAQGISRRTLFRVRSRVGVETERIGFGRKGEWFWRLAAADTTKSANGDDEPSKSAISADMALYGEPPVNQPDFPRVGSKSATSQEMALYENSDPRDAWVVARAERDAVWDAADERFRQGFSSPQPKATTS
jgi:hypothetical protein